jgi:hypothetical protein
VPDLPADRGSNKRVTIGVRTGVSRQDFTDQMKSAADTIDFRFKEDPKFKKVSGVGDLAFFEDRTLHALKGDIEVVVYVDTGEEIPSPGLLWGPEQWRRYREIYPAPSGSGGTARSQGSRSASVKERRKEVLKNALLPM